MNYVLYLTCPNSAVGLHLSGLIWTTNHSDMQKIRIIGFFFFTLDAGLLARSQYSEVPATGHLDTGFSWFPCV